LTRLRVNGTDYDLETHPRAALLWALRDELGFASAKYGCGAEQCGACRVLIDGVAMSSCVVTIEASADSEITTLEGLVADGRASGVVDALLAIDAGQCGYCLPGIVTTLTAVAERPTPPTRDDIVRALDAHLCRCGAQPRIIRAACDALGVTDE
jgi:aerobic-type carbon monoxide dehydrogenase small subunit (CoxS/CutS family)